MLEVSCEATLRYENINRIDLPQALIERIVAAVRRAVDTVAVYIFGSFARGDQKVDSDIDIYVVTPDAAENRHDAVVKIGVELFGLGVARDVLAGSPEQFAQKAAILGSVESDVRREGVLIYG